MSASRRRIRRRAAGRSKRVAWNGRGVRVVQRGDEGPLPQAAGMLAEASAAACEGRRLAPCSRSTSGAGDHVMSGVAAASAGLRTLKSWCFVAQRSQKGGACRGAHAATAHDAGGGQTCRRAAPARTPALKFCDGGGARHTGARGVPEWTRLLFTGCELGAGKARAPHPDGGHRPRSSPGHRRWRPFSRQGSRASRAAACDRK